MIHLTNITKQHGSRVLFRDASMQILPATRTGLVGPNGAGKTTLFRLITGQEEPDKGEISCSKRTVIGYFSQEVGEMSGRSALAEVMAAAGAITALGEQIREMEAAMSTPMADDEMTALLERYGNATEEFEHRGGYDLENRAQAVLTGLRHRQRPLRLSGRDLQRRLEDAHRPGRHPHHQPGCSAARRADQPS